MTINENQQKQQFHCTQWRTSMNVIASSSGQFDGTPFRLIVAFHCFYLRKVTACMIVLVQLDRCCHLFGDSFFAWLIVVCILCFRLPLIRSLLRTTLGGLLHEKLVIMSLPEVDCCVWWYYMFVLMTRSAICNNIRIKICRYSALRRSDPTSLIAGLLLCVIFVDNIV